MNKAVICIFVASFIANAHATNLLNQYNVYEQTGALNIHKIEAQNKNDSSKNKKSQVKDYELLKEFPKLSDNAKKEYQSCLSEESSSLLRQRSYLKRNYDNAKLSFDRYMTLLESQEKVHAITIGSSLVAAAAEPKELVIIPEKYHTDLYDRTDVIPFDRIEKFFKTNLK